MLCTIGFGGGKAIDTAKCVAMGDELSTYFEARATSRSYSNVNAGLPCGYREGFCGEAKGMNTALALAKLCYETLLKDGEKAKISSDCNQITPALENIIEANILLSGVAFESGGLAAAHAIHDGLTILEGTHHYFHGEKGVFGTIVQLVLENAPEEELSEKYKIMKKKTINKQKVSLISGGGSGHEPAHAGFIGTGMHDAAVCGDVFASPSQIQVYRAIRETEMEYGVGIHGEPGIKREQMISADELAQRMVHALLEELEVVDEEIALLINGFGSTPLQFQL